MATSLKVAGAWRPCSDVRVKVGGVWKLPKSGWVKAAGVWKSWFLMGGVNDSVFSRYTYFFYPYDGPNSAVYSIATQTDGKILVGGSFTYWSGERSGPLVRLNSDGTRDTAFTTNAGTAANSLVLSVAVQTDGKILVGGNLWNGTTNDYIVRLLATGARDTAFTTNVGTGASSNVNAIATQTDGKIVVGGVFATWNGTTVNYIVRLNSDGTRDTAFTTATGTGASGEVNSIAVQTDGKILVGGSFTTWNGTTVNRIVRLNSDGTRDTAFTTNTGTAANSSVSTVAVQTDGKILVGGGFSKWNGDDTASIVRLNSDGTRDTAFATNTGTGASANVSTVAVQTDGKIVLGGSFTTWNGTTVNRIVRLNADGTRDTAFTANTGTGVSATVSTVAVQADGKIILGGDFTTWNGTAVGRIVRLLADGTRDTAFTTNAGAANASSSVSTVAVQAGGKIVVGGSFATWNGVTANYIVRLNSDGTRDTAFATNAGTAANSTVTSIAVQSDGRILVGGVFATWNGTDAGRIVRLGGDIAA